MDRGALVIGTDDLRFRLHCLNRGLFNVSTLRRRQFDGALYSTKNSGAHWLKYMLGLTIAELHGLAPPEHLGSHDIIGDPKSSDFPPGIPRIVTAHSIAHLALRWPAVVRHLSLPQYVILVRDIRVVLVSLYEKWHGGDDLDFSTFLRGDLTRRHAYVCDIWELMHFHNYWGPVVERFPERCLALRYEDLLEDPPGQLDRVCRHLGIDGASAELLGQVVARASKGEMAKRPDPAENRHWRVVREDARPPLDWYGEADRHFLEATLGRHLKYTFGYRYD
jgi:hypothetical protein